jgi:hypothetical protein
MFQIDARNSCELSQKILEQDEIAQWGLRKHRPFIFSVPRRVELKGIKVRKVADFILCKRRRKRDTPIPLDKRTKVNYFGIYNPDLINTSQAKDLPLNQN